MSIWSDNYERYLDAGLSVVPLAGKKTPKGLLWAEFQTRLPSISECEAWEEKHSTEITGIGLILGPVSGITALDCDVPEWSDKLPRGMVEREGRPGRFVRFFQNNDEKTTHLASSKLSILAKGSLVVLPPSIHPDTKEPYKWTVNALPFEDLTLLSTKAVTIFAATIKNEPIKPGQPNDLSVEGRNNALTALSYAMACNGDSIPDIRDALLNSEHASWFSDKTEPHRGKFPKTQATKMAERAIKKSIDKGERVESMNQDLGDWTPPAEVQAIPLNKEPTPEVIDTTYMLEDERDALLIADMHMPKTFPTPPPGILFDTMELISKRNYNCDVPGCGLAGALAIFATLASNRVKFEKTWPTLICVGVAPSGTGKQTAQDIALEVLSPIGLKGQLYKSGASMIAGLEEQRERLDIIDEFDDLLNKIKSGTVFQTEIMSFLTSAWTSSKGLFSTATTQQSRKEGKTAEFYNPCINILGFGTVDRVVAASTEAMAHQGFYPRMLVFRDERSKEWRQELTTEQERPMIDRLKALARLVVEGMPIEKRPQELTDIHGNKIGDQALLNARDEIRVPRDLVFDSEPTLDWWIDYKKWANAETTKLSGGKKQRFEKEHVMTMFASRRAEHCMRIAIVACFAEWVDKCANSNSLVPVGFKETISLQMLGAPRRIIQTKLGPIADDDREGLLPWTIRLDHLKWAADVVEYCYFQQAELLGQIVMNDQVTILDKRSSYLESAVENKIGKKGFEWKNIILQGFKSSQRKEVDQVLSHLSDSGHITITTIRGHKGPERKLVIRAGQEIEVIARLKLVQREGVWFQEV